MNSAILLKVGKYLLDSILLKKPRKIKRLDRYSIQILQGLSANPAYESVSSESLATWSISQAKALMEQLDEQRVK